MTAAPDPLFLDLQEALAGRYSLDRELGRGGMGIVYLAREVHLDRLVAIKVLRPEHALDATLRERFLREARLAAKLSHPNIIPIHAVEEVRSFTFYVMAFIDGETLADRVRTRGPVGTSEGARILREAAWALAYAHGQGLVHRDVKPDNLILERATARVLVADFGIAAAFSEAADEGIAGTPEFMSPEQALGTALDARSDLYGLGATAFFAFSGRVPFEGTSATEVLAKQVTEPPPPLASLGVVVPRKLAALVDRCLAKEPAQRPESAQALAEQLGVALEHRRELPVALRAFVKRDGRMDGSGTLLTGVALLPAAVVASAFYGAAAGFGVLFAGAVALPFGYLVRVAGKVVRLGFAHQDLAPAFASEAEQAREELAVHRLRSRPSFLERALPVVARTTGIAFGIGVGASLVGGPWVLNSLGLPWVLLMPTSFISAIGAMSLAQRRRDIDTEFWAKVWTGRIGRSVFAVARRLLGSRAPVSAMTHRATELSLGMAAEQLFAALPKEARAALGDLPAVLAKLQEDAQALRTRYDDLQEALAAAGDAAAGDGYAEVRAARDEIHAKLSETVGARESIRLNLLRLHAGSASVQSLTTHLGVAAEVSAQVERLIAAHEEVEHGLRFPREIATTPA